MARRGSGAVVQHRALPSDRRARLHASLDGRPLTLQGWADDTMLEATVPAGHHVVTLEYWPEAFTIGLVIGGAVVVCFAALAVVTARRGRRRVAPAP